MTMTAAIAPGDWQDRLAELAFTCAAAGAGEAGDLVLAAHDLMAGAPGEWGRRLAGLPDRNGLVRLIAAGGVVAAALALIEGRAGLMLSQPESGCPMATVVFEGLTGEASAEGDCLALALIGATAAALAGPALRLDGKLEVGAPPPGLRLN